MPGTQKMRCKKAQTNAGLMIMRKILEKAIQFRFYYQGKHPFNKSHSSHNH